ncbi:MAG: DUF1254 domain-containing protein, partial [Candidatus Accumulibacter sp.]|uniref:DUF1254 domain-containing protein n=1 Tax=Accumulibacter sp. TaxID=2053492 RepID=UPI001A5074BC
MMIWSELMDAKSLFLTANADTVYFFGCIDLPQGPMVCEAPSAALGVSDDMRWRWVTDSRWCRHQHCPVSLGRGQARPGHGAAGDGLPRRRRQGDEHHSARRLQLL